jgi:hypothetical protein
VTEHVMHRIGVTGRGWGERLACYQGIPRLSSVPHDGGPGDRGACKERCQWLVWNSSREKWSSVFTGERHGAGVGLE